MDLSGLTIRNNCIMRQLNFWTLLVVCLFAGNIVSIPQAHPAEDSPRAIVSLFLTDPVTADKKLKDLGSFEARMYRVLLLGTVFSERPGVHDEIGKIVTGLAHEVREKGEGQSFYAFFTKIVSDPGHYDGNWVEWLRFLSVANDGRIGLLHHQILVPCELIVRHSELRHITGPEIGSSMDIYFPINDCNKFHNQLPETYYQYGEYIWRFSGSYQKSGTIRFMQIRHNDIFMENVILFPEQMADWPLNSDSIHNSGTDNKKPMTCYYPLQKWAYLSLWNWKKFETSKVLFHRAFDDMVTYYRRVHSLPEETARRKAGAALYGLGFEGHWSGMKCPLESLRHAILTGEDPNEISKGIKSGRYNVYEWVDGYPGEREYFYEHALSYSEPPEPIMHIAIFRPEIVEILLENGVNPEQENGWNKTPLMSAAQHNLVESARLLLRAGANPNAATSEGQAARPILLRRRTPLMYAAANSSLELIEFLITQGADIHATDSMKNSACDYLSGIINEVPWYKDDVTSLDVPPNHTLSAADTAKARNLLCEN